MFFVVGNSCFFVDKDGAVISIAKLLLLLQVSAARGVWGLGFVVVAWLLSPLWETAASFAGEVGSEISCGELLLLSEVWVWKSV